MASIQRCRRSRRRREADSHWLISLAAHGAVLVTLSAALRRSPLGGSHPAVEAAWLIGHIVATEAIVWTIRHLRR